MSELILYTTYGCHLCEEALAVLQEVLADAPRALREVEIAEDSQLLERYGVRIPVLAVSDREGELGWPFGAVEVRSFISEV